MMQQRLGLQPGVDSLAQITAPRGTDQPFLSLASTGYIPTSSTQYPAPSPSNLGGTGTQNTFFRRTDGASGANTGINPSVPRLFQKTQNNQGTITDPNAAMNPYLKYQLMSKIFNNVTTRSNVFAVWVTVGFFEVIDDTTRPVKLGAEIGRAEGRQVRHRMFGIVDRTALTSFSTTSTQAIQPTAPGASVTVTPAQMSGFTASGVAWSIQPGTILEIGPDGPGNAAVNIGQATNEETVVVTAVAAGNFTANFQYAHAPGCSIAVRGNPGPWTRFNPKANAALVPYFAIID
jgi:hypothetical protein